jgi:hypothetical protein
MLWDAMLRMYEAHIELYIPYDPRTCMEHGVMATTVMSHIDQWACHAVAH